MTQKIFEIPVIYSSWGIVNIVASSIEEATKLALDSPLPYDPEYIEDSLQIDYDSPIYLSQKNETENNDD